MRNSGAHMNRIALAVTTLALAAGCARQAQATAPAPAPVRGKPSAPVAIDARLAAASARVTIRFDADAKDVRIDVHGTDGLAVTGTAPTPAEHASFKRGETTAFDVAFTPGPGRSYLVVGVAGKFHGAGKRARVASFPTGEPTPEQEKGMGTVVEGPDGERLKVVVPGE